MRLWLALDGGEFERLLPLLVELRRGEPLEVRLAPPEGALPEGFVYVPAGRFWFGAAEPALVRRFLDAPPLSERTTPAFLIARHEVTYADWLAFLGELSPPERARRSPRAGGASVNGTLSLAEDAGTWRLRMQPADRLLVAARGVPLRYPSRKTLAEQRWERIPVSGVSLDDARAYTVWLDRTGRIRGARLCTELEWERAARGADARSYPHGDQLAPGDANFDETYGGRAEAFGPDEVGAHPASRSPFGLHDLAGNVCEWTESVFGDRGLVRGGAFYFDRKTLHVANRIVTSPAFRDLTVGLRVCASAE